MESPMKMIGAKTAAALLALAVGAAVARDENWGREADVKQPGQYEWRWDGGDKLTIGIPASVRYTPEGAPRIVITGPDELLSHIRLDKGGLGIKENNWRYRGVGAQVTITGVTVHEITLAGSGRIALEKLNLDRLRLTVAGSGAMTGEGRADQLDVTVAGSGSSDLSRLSVRRANIDIAGSGRVSVTPRDEANLSVTGSGTVVMTSRPPRLTQSIVGSGGVRVGAN